ncbi:uncharacterized protein [Pleurodeles waltl]|uniref:uncharacterized protein n=1 Tax=Pleurodeles waltl TaxID=8319 RepID=UPI003709AE32
MMTYLAPVLAAALLVGLANSLKCYSCSLSLNRAACGTVANCSSGSSCMKVVKKSTSYYRYTAPLDPPTPSSGDPPAGQEEEAPPIMNHSVVAGRDGTWKTEKSVALGRQEEDTAQPSRHRAAANRRRRAPQEGGRAGVISSVSMRCSTSCTEGAVSDGKILTLYYCCKTDLCNSADSVMLHRTAISLVTGVGVLLIRTGL